MPWKLAVPSYRRAETIAKKTIPLLQRHGVDPGRVTVFVADTAEEARYKKSLPAAYRGRIVVAVPGMGAVRRFIQAYYEEGDEVVSIDDDIDEVWVQVSRKEKRPITNLGGFFDEAFSTTAALGAKLWGVYPVDNPYFMRRTVSTDLKYIVGCLWGCVNSRDSRVSVSLDDKEDFERTILFYLRDGRVARFNYICPTTAYYGEPGGMQVERTTKRITESAKELVARYPSLCKLFTSKSRGVSEVRLRDTRAKC